MSPLISVCIPTYNGAPYISECLNSVISQDYGDFEIVIVDDKSTDNTAEICETYSERDKRIRFYRNKHNLGLVGNWNQAIEHAKGEWIKFLFQDDKLSSNCLSEFKQAINLGADLLCARREFIFEDVTVKAKKGYLKHQQMLDRLYPFSEATLVTPLECQENIIKNIRKPHFLQMDNLYGEPTCIMFKKSVFEKVGPFNPRIIHMCDLEHSHRLAIENGLVFIPRTLAYFRVHGTAATSTNHQDKSFRMHYHDPIEILNSFRKDYQYEKLRIRSNFLRLDLDRLFVSYIARLQVMVMLRKKYRKEWAIAIEKYKLKDILSRITYFDYFKITMKMTYAKFINLITQ